MGKIVKGIILFTLCFYSHLAAQNNAFPLKSSLWHTNIISVCWDNPTTENAAMRAIVQQVITDTWQKYSALQFTDWCPATEKDGDIHIFINEEEPYIKGVGTCIKNMPHGIVLNFTFNKLSYLYKFDKTFRIKAIAVHEFGHALGFAHEQNNDACYYDNCLGKEQSNVGDWYFSQCARRSIMNYCSPYFTNDKILSKLDIEAVQYLYGLPADKSNQLSSATIVHNPEYIGIKRKLKRYNFKIYVSAAAEDFDRIECVTYNLEDADGIFKNPVITAVDKYSHFGIELLDVWFDCDIKATITYKDKTIKKVVHHLAIDYDGIQQPSADTPEF